MRFRRSAIPGSVLALALVLGGCSNDDTLPTVASRPTTTSVTAAADLEEPPDALPAGDIVAALESAVSAEDFCALAAAMDLASPDPADPAGVVVVYDELAKAAAAGRAFLPPELRLDWETIVAGTEEGATAVADADGDLADPAVELAFTASAMVQAIETIERYQIKQCAGDAGG